MENSGVPNENKSPYHEVPFEPLTPEEAERLKLVPNAEVRERVAEQLAYPMARQDTSREEAKAIEHLAEIPKPEAQKEERPLSGGAGQNLFEENTESAGDLGVRTKEAAEKLAAPVVAHETASKPEAVPAAVDSEGFGEDPITTEDINGNIVTIKKGDKLYQANFSPPNVYWYEIIVDGINIKDKTIKSRGLGTVYIIAQLHSEVDKKRLETWYEKVRAEEAEEFGLEPKKPAEAEKPKENKEEELAVESKPAEKQKETKEAPKTEKPASEPERKEEPKEEKSAAEKVAEKELEKSEKAEKDLGPEKEDGWLRKLGRKAKGAPSKIFFEALDDLKFGRDYVDLAYNRLWGRWYDFRSGKKISKLHEVEYELKNLEKAESSQKDLIERLKTKYNVRVGDAARQKALQEVQREKHKLGDKADKIRGRLEEISANKTKFFSARDRICGKFIDNCDRNIKVFDEELGIARVRRGELSGEIEFCRKALNILKDKRDGLEKELDEAIGRSSFMRNDIKKYIKKASENLSGMEKTLNEKEAAIRKVDGKIADLTGKINPKKEKRNHYARITQLHPLGVKSSGITEEKAREEGSGETITSPEEGAKVETKEKEKLIKADEGVDSWNRIFRSDAPIDKEAFRKFITDEKWNSEMSTDEFKGYAESYLESAPPPAGRKKLSKNKLKAKLDVFGGLFEVLGQIF